MITTGSQQCDMKTKASIIVKNIRNTNLYRQKNYKSKDQEGYLQAGKDIDEDKVAYLEEYIKIHYYNPVNEKQDAPIQEDQEEIEIPGVDKISFTDSTASNVRRSQREIFKYKYWILKRKDKYKCNLIRSKDRKIDQKETNNQILRRNKKKHNTKIVHP